MNAGTSRRNGARRIVTEARPDRRIAGVARGERRIPVEAGGERPTVAEPRSSRNDSTNERVPGTSGGRQVVQWFSGMARRIVATVSIAISTTVAAWVGLHTPIQTASGEVVLAKYINLEALRELLREFLNQ